MACAPESAVPPGASLGADKESRRPEQRDGPTAGAGYERGYDLGRMAVKGQPGPVVAHGRSRARVRSRLLGVAKGYARVQGRGFQQSIRVLAGSRVVRSELPQAFLDLAVGIPLGVHVCRT